MGKSKSRILRKAKNDIHPKISRQDAVCQVVKYLNERDIISASEIVTLFGLNAEEVLEAGADYEAVTAIRNIFKCN